MNEFNNRYDVYNLVCDLIIELGNGQQPSSSEPLSCYDFDSLDAIDLAMRIENRLEIENLTVTTASTPALVADCAWEIYSLKNSSKQ